MSNELTQARKLAEDLKACKKYPETPWRDSRCNPDTMLDDLIELLKDIERKFDL